MITNKDTTNRTRIKPTIIRLLITGCVLVCVLAFFVLIIKGTGLWSKINSVEKLQNIVGKGGIVSCLIFVVLQILQTTILQIPSVVVTFVGTLIFGALPAFFMSYFSIVLGSVIMFFVGRQVGRKFINWLVGESVAEKWITQLTDCKYMFFLMMLFPLFPDDIMCAVAGVTNMSFKFFMITNFVSRGVGVFTTVFLGSGKIIPFSGWGIFVWLAIGIFALLCFYLSVKYRDQIDEIFIKFNKK